MRMLCFVGCLFFCLLFPGEARAQLAQSFYNITNIKTDILPNAVRVTVETDGTVNMGVDFREFLDFGPNGDDFSATALRRFRLRFVGVRAKIPAFVEIGKFPFDSVNIQPSREPLQNAFFYRSGSNYNPNNPAVPALDLELWFYVPIKVTYFTFEFNETYGWNFNYPVFLNPLEVSIVVAADRRSVIITAITDRIEANRTLSGPRRSPKEQYNHRLTVSGTAKNLKVDALHAPVGELLTEITKATGVPLMTQPDTETTEVSLFLPGGTVADVLKALGRGSGLSSMPRPDTEGGGYLVGRAGAVDVSERIPVYFTLPETLRLLLPDFLLPSLRADTENNALIATGSPELIAKLRADITKLDVRPAIVRVEALAYEFRDTDEASIALRGLLSEGKAAFDTASGTVSTLLQPGQREQFQVRLDALVAAGKVQLRARPFVVVETGKKGTLFFGQTRFLTVLSGSFEQNATILTVPVGTTLTVIPETTNTSDGEILLELSPRFSTVDAIEVGTGLPTPGIREIKSTVRLRESDTILVAGLESRNESQQRSGLFGWGRGAKAFRP